MIGSPRTETVTLYFPDIVPFQYDYGEEVFSVDEISDAWGAEQRMAIVEGRVALRGTLDYLTVSQKRQIRDFIVDSAKMRIKPFYIFAGPDEEWFSQDIGLTTTDGVLAYALPFKKMASRTDAYTMWADDTTFGTPAGTGSGLFLGGTSQVLGTDYTISANANGELVVTFASNPGGGQTLTWSVRARARYPVRLAETSQGIKFLPSADSRGIREISVREIL